MRDLAGSCAAGNSRVGKPQTLVPGCDVPVNVGVQVVGPTIVGRSVTILGEAGFNASRQWASDCDLLVHPATSQV